MTHSDLLNAALMIPEYNPAPCSARVEQYAIKKRGHVGYPPAFNFVFQRCHSLSLGTPYSA